MKVFCAERLVNKGVGVAGAGGGGKRKTVRILRLHFSFLSSFSLLFRLYFSVFDRV